MDTDPIDLLQIKIEKAKENLSEETLRSINAVDWKKAIIDMRGRKGYSFEQLEDLEIETELLLCGLESPDDYPKEVERRLGLSKVQTADLMRELNASIFQPIREEFIKISEAEKPEKEEKPAPLQRDDTPIETPAEILKNLEEKELPAGPAPKPVFAPKLSAPFKAPIRTTEYTLGNLSKRVEPAAAAPKPEVPKPKLDPYREIPE